jgi:hypothetical protein
MADLVVTRVQVTQHQLNGIERGQLLPGAGVCGHGLE